MIHPNGPRVRMVTCALLAALVAPAMARAETPASLDCYLTHSELQCQDVRSALDGSVADVRWVSGDAPWSVGIRDVETGIGRRYFVRFRGVPIGGTDSVDYRISREVPHSAGHDRTLALLVATVQQGLVPFLRVDEPGGTSDGALSLTARTSDAPTPTAPSPWYLRPRIGGEYFGGNLTSINAMAGLEANYSDPEWRWRLDGEARYRYLDIDLPGASLRGDFIQFRASTVGARALVDGLSLAVRVEARGEPQNNLDVRGRAGGGIEWVLSPFLAANETNVGARLLAQGVFDRYTTETLNGERERLYFEPRLEAFGRVHTDPVDFELSGGAAFVADAPENWWTWAELEATFRIVDGLQLGVSGGLLYRGDVIQAPADRDALNPIAATTGSSLQELTANASLNLSWAFGNSLLRSQDQRWQ